MALTPGEKITIIKSASATLANENWSDITLTLDLFDIPDIGDDEWRNYYDYVSQRLRQTMQDDALVGLYGHLFPDASIEEAAIDTPLQWKEGYFRLFMSHTKANKKLAGKIRERLLGRGVDAYVAHDMIEPTKEWMDEIEAALRTCDATAAILSEDFVQSQWCDQEIGVSIGRRLLILAVRQGADPHGFISKFQAIPGDATSTAPETIADNIYATLVSHDLTKAKMAIGTVHAYTGSPNVDDARANLARVKEIPKPLWTEDMVTIAERAGQKNPALSEGELFERPIPRLLSDHLDELLERATTNGFSPPSGSSDDDIPF